MEYELSKYAQDVLAKRKIPLAWITDVLEHPRLAESDDIDPELEHRLGRVVEYENRVLHVIVNNQTSPPRIVTAYFDRKMRDRL